MDTINKFENLQVEVNNLPKVENLVFQPLEERYRTVLILSKIFAFLVGSLIVIIVLRELNDKIPKELQYGIIAIVILNLIWGLINAIKGFKHKSYALRQKDIIYKSGWLWKQMTTAPFNRVQHVRIDQGVIERKFNLAKLKIFTAGGNSSDLSIPGLDPVTANELKEFIVKKTLQDEEE